MITPSFSPTATERVLPKLALDFTTASLDSRVTFTRSTSASNPATYVNSSGVITSATDNQPRFDYDPITLVCKGLLIEEIRTNALNYSNDLVNAAWNKATATILDNSLVAPDGTQTADVYVQNNGASGELNRAVATTLTADKDFTISGFFKSVNGLNSVQFYTSSGGNGFQINFNPITGSVNSAGALGTGTYRNSGVIAYPNGWFRVWVSGRAATGVTSINAFRLLPGTGDGSKGIAVWGAQVEQSTTDISFPTSYIPTTTTALTRNADVATMTGTNFSSWFNQSQGSFEAEYSCNLTSGSDRRIVSAVDSSFFGTNFISMFVSNGAQKAASINSFVSGSNIGRVDSSQAFVANTTYKGMFSYKTNSRVVTTSANAPSISSNTFAPPVLTMAIFGSDNVGSGNINGYLKKINYYNLAVTNAELQSFTK